MAGEAVLDFCLSNNVPVKAIAVDKFTMCPEESAAIPSRRKGGMNAFSETDMMMNSSVSGIPVKRLDMLPEVAKKDLILVTGSEHLQEICIQSLTDQGFLNVIPISLDLLESICAETYSTYELYQKHWNLQWTAINELQLLRNCTRRQLRPTIYDFHFEFHIVEHCNLRCRGCTHFAPLAEEEYLDIHEFERDIARLSYLTGRVARFINLLGGEPLLHPEIADFFYVARKYFPDAIIRVVTNGILLMKMKESFWKSCRENGIVIGVTEYPINIDYDEIKDFIILKQVEFATFSGNGVRDEMWQLFLDEKGRNRPIDNFMRCPRANACVFCSHGKIFTCATMANIGHFNQYFHKNLELSEWDYVDIHKVDSIAEIFKYLQNPTPFCRFCNIDRRKYGVRWALSQKKIEEWT